MARRKRNERRFKHWEDLPNDARRYWYDSEREDGFTIRYIKVVNANEQTMALIQEVYDRSGKLVEVHEKFPVDRGHRRV